MAKKTSLRKAAAGKAKAPQAVAPSVEVPEASKIRNRNVETRRVRAGELVPHPKNWRAHSSRQAGALRGVLEEIGFVGTLIARDTPDGLQLIDGHLRAETVPEELVDVTIVSGEVASMLSDYMDELGGAPRAGRTTERADESTAEYPLSPVFNEKYEYAIIFCRDETEWGALQTLLELRREKSYKSSGIAVGRVIPFGKFFDLWEDRALESESDRENETETL